MPIIYKDPILVRDYLSEYNYSCKLRFYCNHRFRPSTYFELDDVLDFYVISAMALDSDTLYIEVSHEPPKP